MNETASQRNRPIFSQYRTIARLPTKSKTEELVRTLHMHAVMSRNGGRLEVDKNNDIRYDQVEFLLKAIGEITSSTNAEPIISSLSVHIGF